MTVAELEHGPTPRWTPATLHEQQLGYLRSDAWMNVVVAGRRSFKTEAAKRRIFRAAITFAKHPDGRFFACAPTHQQAKDIFWADLKALTPAFVMLGESPDEAISESELTIKLRNGSIIKVAGLDRPQRIEGTNWDGGVISEFGDIKPGTFEAHVLPMLIRGGWIDIEGVPEGRNHYFQLAEAVRRAQEHPDDAQVEAFRGARLWQWTTEETLHLWLGEERARATLARFKATMDEATYRQELLAHFVDLEGRAYYAFKSGINTPPLGERVLYSPSDPLIACFDFNRKPGVCCVAQEIDWRRLRWLELPSSRSNTITSVIGEVYLERNSNTAKVCDKFIADWADIHGGEVLVYGDASGGAKTSSAVAGSDWDIVYAKFKAAFGHRVRFRYGRSNPAVRARVNAMNARCASADHSVGLVVDPIAAPHVVMDFEGVEVDDQGALRKEQGGPLTHITDALGYYVAQKWPLGASASKVREEDIG